MILIFVQECIIYSLSFILKEIWRHSHVAQAGLKLKAIFLLQLPKSQNYRHEPPHPAY